MVYLTVNIKISDYFHLFDNMFQIQHPRSDLNRFDLVITPHHDYYPLTPHAQEQIPWFMRRWITPREPPGKNVVGILDEKYLNIALLIGLHLILINCLQLFMKLTGCGL